MGIWRVNAESFGGREMFPRVGEYSSYCKKFLISSISELHEYNRIYENIPLSPLRTVPCATRGNESFIPPEIDRALRGTQGITQGTNHKYSDSANSCLELHRENKDETRI
jgi:hypothetical protein